MTRPVDAVIDFLETQKSRGLSHIYLDDGARDGLRELFIRASTPLPKVTAPTTSAPAILTVSGEGKAARLDSIRQQAATWAPTQSLGTLREKMVFATGNPDAEIMLVGEAPGYNEEKEGEPFVGPAGQKLNDILKAMGITREQTYISNLVKFRPTIPKQTTNNRKPDAREMAASLPLIQAEIDIIQPKVIVALGGTVAEGLLGLEGVITAMRGRWHQLGEIPVRVTYHPSYLLQSGDNNRIKRALWEDMLAVMEKLGIPISEKQRGFFLPK